MKRQHLAHAQHLRHHAFVIEAEAEEGIEHAQAWAREQLGMKIENNPDVVVLRYGLLSVGDARRVCELAASAPLPASIRWFSSPRTARITRRRTHS